MTLPNSSSINAYGSGILVDAVPTVDPTSEMPAAAMNAMRNDVSAMTATAPRCIMQYNGTSTIVHSNTWASGFDSNWGNALPVQPVISHIFTGAYSIQFPSTVQDQLGNSILVNIRNARATMMASAVNAPAQGLCSVWVNAASVITVFTTDYSGTPADFTGATIFLEIF